MTSKIHSAQLVSGGIGAANTNSAGPARPDQQQQQQGQRWQNQASGVQQGATAARGLTSAIDKRSQKLKEEIDRLKSFIPPIPPTTAAAPVAATTTFAPAPTVKATDHHHHHYKAHSNPCCSQAAHPPLAPLASLDYTSITTTTSTIEPSGSTSNATASASQVDKSGAKTSNYHYYSCDREINREQRNSSKTSSNTGATLINSSPKPTSGGQLQSPSSTSSGSSVDTPTLSGYFDCDELSDMVDDSLFEITTAGCLSRSVFPRDPAPASCRLNYATGHLVGERHRNRRHVNDQAASIDAPASQPGTSSEQLEAGDGATDDPDGDRTPTGDLHQHQLSGAGSGAGASVSQGAHAKKSVLTRGRSKSRSTDSSDTDNKRAVPLPAAAPPPLSLSSTTSQVASIMAHVQSHDYSSTTSVPRQIRSSLTIASATLASGPASAAAAAVTDTSIVKQDISGHTISTNSTSSANTKISSFHRGPAALGNKVARQHHQQTSNQEQLDQQQQQRKVSSPKSLSNNQQQQRQRQLVISSNTDTSNDADIDSNDCERRTITSSSIAPLVNRKLSNYNKSQSSGALASEAQASSSPDSKCPICGGGGNQAIVMGDKHKLTKKGSAHKGKRKFTFSLFNLFTGGGGGSSGDADRRDASDENSDNPSSGRRQLCCCHRTTTATEEHDRLARTISISGSSTYQASPSSTMMAGAMQDLTTAPGSSSTKESASSGKPSQRAAKSATPASNRAPGQASSGTGRTPAAKQPVSQRAEYHPLPAMRLRDSIKITNQRKLRSSAAATASSQRTSGANNRDQNQGEFSLDCLARQSQSVGARLSNSGGGGNYNVPSPRRTAAPRPSDSSTISASSALSTASSSFNRRPSQSGASGTRANAGQQQQQQQQQRQGKCVKFTTPDRVILSSPKNTSSSLASRRRQQQRRQDQQKRATTTQPNKPIAVDPSAQAQVLAPIIKRPAAAAAAVVVELEMAQPELPQPTADPGSSVPKSSSYSQTEPNKSVDELLARYECNTELVAQINEKLHLTETIASNLSALDESQSGGQLDTELISLDQALRDAPLNQEEVAPSCEEATIGEALAIDEQQRRQLIDCGGGEQEQVDRGNATNIAGASKTAATAVGCDDTENDADDDEEQERVGEGGGGGKNDDDESEDGKVVILEEEDEDELIQRRLEFIEASRVFSWGPDDELAAMTAVSATTAATSFPTLATSNDKDTEMQRRRAVELELEAAEADEASKCECNRTESNRMTTTSASGEIGAPNALESNQLASTATDAGAGTTICKNNKSARGELTDSILVAAEGESAISSLNGLDLHGGDGVESAGQQK